MTEKERQQRASCQCETCSIIRNALGLLDDIATSPANMGCDDIDKLTEAREVLAHEVGAIYDETTERYTSVSTV